MARWLALIPIACGGARTETVERIVVPADVLATPAARDAGAPSAPVAQAAPVPPQPFLRDVSQLSVGSAHVCAVTTSHAVVCWGDNAAGELGIGRDGHSVGGSLSRPHLVGGLPEMASVGAGKMHTCAIDLRGNVFCWGSAGGDLVETGGGAAGSVELHDDALGTPVQMPLGAGGARLVALSTMTNAACAAFPDEVRCWDTFRAITVKGRLTSAPSLHGARLAGVTALALGHGKVCAIADTKLWCWHGDDAPTPAVWGRDAFAPVKVAIGEMYACVASASGDVRCWWSLIDDFWKKPPNRDVRWPGKPATRAIAVGDSPICTANSAGVVDCFLSEEGGLTDDAAAASWATKVLGPHPIAGIDGAVNLGLGAGRNVMGFGFGCALRGVPDSSGAQVFCWGDNESGQLGSGNMTSTKTAVRVVGG